MIEVELQSRSDGGRGSFFCGAGALTTSSGVGDGNSVIRYPTHHIIVTVRYFHHPNQCVIGISILALPLFVPCIVDNLRPSIWSYRTLVLGNFYVCYHRVLGAGTAEYGEYCSNNADATDDVQKLLHLLLLLTTILTRHCLGCFYLL